MTGHPKVILAQTNPTVGQVRQNCDLIKSVWDQYDGTADIIAFPELCLCGYPPDDLVLKPVFINHVRDALNDLVALSTQYETAILVSCPSRVDGHLLSAAHVIHDGAIIGTAYKHVLPNYGVFDEKRIFTAGDFCKPIPFKDFNFGILICED